MSALDKALHYTIKPDLPRWAYLAELGPGVGHLFFQSECASEFGAWVGCGEVGYWVALGQPIGGDPDVRIL